MDPVLSLALSLSLHPPPPVVCARLCQSEPSAPEKRGGEEREEPEGEQWKERESMTVSQLIKNGRSLLCVTSGQLGWVEVGPTGLSVTE